MKAAVSVLMLALGAGALFCSAVFAPTTGVEAPCTCLSAPATNGWCEKHGIGYVAMVPIRSRMLFDTLDAHGHEVDLTTFQCPVCQKAIQTDGICEEHSIGFVNKLAYFTRIAYELARAVYREPAEIECPDCRKNAETSGWCAKHGVGMIGGFAMRDEEGWKISARLTEVLRLAAKKVAECERCAIAIVYDSDCPIHNIFYKDGVPVPPPQAPKPPN